jgi:hypothetical protein
MSAPEPGRRFRLQFHQKFQLFLLMHKLPFIYQNPTHSFETHMTTDLSAKSRYDPQFMMYGRCRLRWRMSAKQKDIRSRANEEFVCRSWY